MDTTQALVSNPSLVPLFLKGEGPSHILVGEGEVPPSSPRPASSGERDKVII